MITSYCLASDICTRGSSSCRCTNDNSSGSPRNSPALAPREANHMALKGNDMRWKPGKRGHYEGYYIAFNQPQSGRGYWIRYSMVAPTDAAREAFAQVWFMRTDRAGEPRHRALRTTFPIDSLRTTTGPFT